MRPVPAADHVLVISLADRLDRRQRITQMMAREEILFEFIDGVRVSSEEIIPEEVADVGWNGEKLGLDRAAYLRGTVGCTRAHVRALERALQLGDGSVLLMEDDAAFHSGWREVLTSAVAELPPGWLQLYLSAAPFRPTVAVGPHLVRLHGAWQATAILYSGDGIRRALDCLRRARCEPDHWLAVHLHPLDGSYCVNPQITFQVAGFSDFRQTWRGVLA